MSDRAGAVVLHGKLLHVRGAELQVGDNAPNFKLTANNWSSVTLNDTSGLVRLISVVPSLDTNVCDLQTRRFNDEAAGLGENVVILTISADLPYAQARWCGLTGVDQVVTLSDHLDMNFGDAYGTHIVELRLDQRSVFVINADNIITYVEYVREFGQQPDYDAALTAVREALA